MAASMVASDYAERFRCEGYVVRDSVVADEIIEQLRPAVAAIGNRQEVRRKRNVYGVRNLLEICPAVRALAGDATSGNW